MSAHETADHPERIKILLYVDTDDPSVLDHEHMVESLKVGQLEDQAILLVTVPSICVMRSVNHLTTLAKGDVFVRVSDDHYFLSRGWDTRLDEKTAKFPDGFYCVWFNDNWESQNFAQHPFSVGSGLKG